MKKFKNTPRLCNYILNNLFRYDTISFDLFDTILIRKVHNPDLVKYPVARYIESLAEKKGIILSWENIQLLRDDIEKNHRIKSMSKTSWGEAVYTEFMQELLQMIFKEKFDKNLLENVIEYELKIELSVLCLRKDFLKLLKILKTKNKKLILISDNYFPSKILEKLLDFFKISNYFDIVYSSADKLKVKGSGRAFRYIEKEYSLNINKWVHIGDNLLSDGFSPEELGIESVVLIHKIGLMRRRLLENYERLAKSNNFWNGLLLSESMFNLHDPLLKKNKAFSFGAKFLSFVFGVYILEVYHYCKKNNIEKIYFLSREGKFFLELWNLIIPEFFPEDESIKTEYLYVSRKALAGSALHLNGLDDSFHKFAFSPGGNKTFGDLLRVYSIPYTDELEEITSVYGILDKTILNDFFGLVLNKKILDKKNKFQNLLEDKNFQDYVNKHTKTQHSNFLKYLKKQDFFNYKNVAFVDVGWMGSMQSFLNISLGNVSKKPFIHGLLLSKVSEGLFERNEYSFLKGIIHDCKSEDAGFEINICPVFFEELCNAEHPTLVSYSNSGDPIFYKDSNFKDKLDKLDKTYLEIKNGVYFGIKEFININRIYNFKYSDLKDYFSFLYKKYIILPDIFLLKKLKNQIKRHGDLINPSNEEKSSLIDFLNPWKSTSLNFLRLSFEKYLFFIAYFFHRQFARDGRIIKYKARKPSLNEILEINFIKVISRIRQYPSGNFSLGGHLVRSSFISLKNKFLNKRK